MTNTKLKNFFPQALNRFHEALDELEDELVRYNDGTNSMSFAEVIIDWIWFRDKHERCFNETLP